MTPAEEITAAAEKLRSLTTFLGDNRGPWKVGTPPSGYPQSISNVGVPFCVADTHEDPSIPVFTIAPYIATMHPGVGKALADWLEQAAHDYECGIRAADDVFHDDPAGREAFLTTGPGAPSPQALAVARALLGGGQP